MKMKGVLKGLKYIAHIFEQEKEPELQIGLPTDVKHVAHIGWDGPSTAAPSWMKHYENNSETLSVTNGSPIPRSAGKDRMQPDARVPRSPGSPTESPGRCDSNKSKKSKRNSPNVSVGSPVHDSTDSNKPRKYKNSDPDSQNGDKCNRPRRPKSSNAGLEPAVQDLPAIPKQSRRKKPKECSDGGSIKSSSRSKGKDYLNSDLDYGYESKKRGSRHGSRGGSSPDSALEVCADANDSDEMPREIRVS